MWKRGDCGPTVTTPKANVGEVEYWIQYWTFPDPASVEACHETVFERPCVKAGSASTTGTLGGELSCVEAVTAEDPDSRPNASRARTRK